MGSVKAPGCLLGTLLLGGVVLGGGGTTNPGNEYLLLLLIAVALPISTAVADLSAVFRRDPVGSTFLLLVVMFPLVQLVPLPVPVWQHLPGRNDSVQVLAALGDSQRWMSFTQFPGRTLAVTLSLAPALLVALLVASMSRSNRMLGLAIILCATVLSAGVGFLQFAAGPDRVVSMYDYVHRGFAIGFFANRNAQADLIAIALVVLVVMVERRPQAIATWSGRFLVAGTMLILVLAAVLTGSRAGMAMLVVPALMAVWLGRAILTRWSTAGLVVGVGVAVVSLALAFSHTSLSRVGNRFTPDDNRQRIWQDSVDVAARYQPVGSGMGNFVPLQQVSERLEVIGPTIANRAHNDYLEVWIEGGLPAVLLLVAMVVFVGLRIAGALQSRDPDRRTAAIFAAGVFLIFAFHSTVDYPLRTMTHLVVAAFAFACLLLPPEQDSAAAVHRELGRSASAR